MRAQQDTVLSEILPPEERVIESVVARYQRVAPAVTRFARTISGNEHLHVRLGSQAASGPGEIVVDPGLFQAAYSRRAPVTPSEVALASALHEVVHLVATDLEEHRAMPREWFPDDFEGDLPEDPVPLLDALAEAGGPAGQALFFSLEDARQESQLFTGYEGARSVLADLYLASVPEALEQARPLGQFALGAFLLTGRYLTRKQVQKRVDPHVAAAIDDAMPFIKAASNSTDTWEVAGIALQLLQIARLHGLAFDVQPTETIGESEEKSKEQADDIQDGVDSLRLITPILADADGYDQTQRTGESVAAEQGRKGDTDEAGDPSTDQLLLVSEAPTVYLPTGQSGKLIVGGVPDRFRHFRLEGHRALVDAARTWGVGQRHVSGELYPLFLANQRRGLRSGYDAGDLSPHAALLLGAGLYERMFERRAISTRRSYAVSLLVDASASMLQPRHLEDARRAPWAMAAATLGAWTLARLADELQIEFEVALFNRAFAAAVDDSEQSYSKRLHAATAGLRQTRGGAADRLSRTVNHYLVKSFDDPWRRSEDVLAGLFYTAMEPRQAAIAARREPNRTPPVSMFEKAANVDEFNVSHAAERLAARRANTRVLVVLADGMTRGSVENLSKAVETVEHSGTTVLGIGIGDPTVQAAYSRNQVVEQPDALAKAMVDGVREALHRTLAELGSGTWWEHGSQRALYSANTRSA
ncbi:MAG: hypothetical protein OEM22_02955 [Acidimicrobiia bacterium]|nr:hypothetical protein [Acidimicrobiia bacterium]MDH3470572.1 hypothetical protein [Acidimicrobiia bacterium]